MAEVSSWLDALGFGLAAVSDGQILFASEPARRLLDPLGDHVPPALAPAVDRATDVPALFVVTIEGRKLAVRVVRRGTLVLLEVRAFVAQRVTMDEVLRRVGATRREREIVELKRWAATSAEIADQLGVSPRTVEQHLNNLYRRTATSGFLDLQRRLRELEEEERGDRQ